MDPNEKDSYGSNALHCAHTLEIAKYLVDEKKMDPNEKNYRGSNALYSASNLEIAKYLMDRKGMVPKEKGFEGNDILHCARNLEVVKYLVDEKGMDPNQKDHKKQNLLHCALNDWGASCDLGVIRYLVEEKRIDPNETDLNGWNALHHASYEGNLGIVKYLVRERGVNVNLKTLKGEAPLDLLSPDTIEYLQIRDLLLKALKGDQQLQYRDTNDTVETSAANTPNKKKRKVEQSSLQSLKGKAISFSSFEFKTSNVTNGEAKRRRETKAKLLESFSKAKIKRLKERFPNFFTNTDEFEIPSVPEEYLSFATLIKHEWIAKKSMIGDFGNEANVRTLLDELFFSRKMPSKEESFKVFQEYWIELKEEDLSGALDYLIQFNSNLSIIVEAKKRSVNKIESHNSLTQLMAEMLCAKRKLEDRKRLIGILTDSMRWRVVVLEETSKENYNWKISRVVNCGEEEDEGFEKNLSSLLHFIFNVEKYIQ
eukprot:TRINITY_DN2435_c0_g1_i11.p1 TRINITY_DN2435_c0_g1~~TRINITY_DN2435_c0_g1_i11.p1  ORF type:complete len:526 (-),score=134.21 TRINITY_DN2435_c0_g1_i11:1011-2456(-)